VGSHTECPITHWTFVLAPKRAVDFWDWLQWRPLDRRSSYHWDSWERSRSRLAQGNSLLGWSAGSGWRSLREDSGSPLALVGFLTPCTSDTAEFPEFWHSGWLPLTLAGHCTMLRVDWLHGRSLKQKLLCGRFPQPIYSSMKILNAYWLTNGGIYIFVLGGLQCGSLKGEWCCCRTPRSCTVTLAHSITKSLRLNSSLPHYHVLNY
jgi:hypothetical protein